MKENILKEKSLIFALNVVDLYKFLLKLHNENVISKQILRSGTSIGANIAESEYAASKADFINKLQISQKEAGETLYWLELLYKSNYITQSQYENNKKDCLEILRLLTASLKTGKNNN